MRDFTTTTIKIDKEKQSRFKALCNLKKTNMSEVIDGFIEQYLKANEDWLPENKGRMN